MLNTRDKCHNFVFKHKGFFMFKRLSHHDTCSAVVPKVSIIVPCFNVAQYIKACLNCLTAQTMQDIEIICIDDCSTDDTLEKIHEYANTSHDKRIKIIKMQQNAGVAAARNAGMNAATGEYIGFVDPDDTVDINFFEQLYKCATKDKSDIAKGITTVIDTDDTCQVWNNNKRVCENKFNFNLCFWSAIYNHNFLKKHNLQFPVGILISEDTVFLIKSVFFANKVATTDTVSYHYIRREGSADSAFLSPRKVKSGLDALHELMTWLNNQPDMTENAYACILKRICEIINYMTEKNVSPSDKKLICETFMWIYKNTKNKRVMLSEYRKRIRHALTNDDIKMLHRCIFTRNTRYRLFGFFPLLKISELPEQEKRFQLLYFIPILTIRWRSHKIRIYSFGLPMLTIKH